MSNRTRLKILMVLVVLLICMLGLCVYLEVKYDEDMAKEPAQTEETSIGMTEDLYITINPDTEDETDAMVSGQTEVTEAETLRPTETLETEPTETDKNPTENQDNQEQIQPKPTEPKPTEPKPTEPKPTEPKPTEPKPTEPKPTEPKPSEPADEEGVDPDQGEII